jgi:hypothetical protein
MKLIQQLNESNKIPSGMTLKQHADIKRELKKKVAELLKQKYAAIEAHGKAERELKAHEKLHPKFAAKEAARNAKMEPYFEPGRSAEPGPR